MKKVFLIITSLVTLVFLFQSCQNEEVSEENRNEIAKIENGKTSFILDKNIVKTKWENELKGSVDNNISFDKIKIIEIDGNYYLRGYSDKYVSTRLLSVENGRMMPLGTTCTTEKCSNSSTECIPQSNGTCSKCWFGDCTRTISN